MWRGRTDSTPWPLHERKRWNPFPSPVSAPCCFLMEVCPLQINSPWCPHQFVGSAVGIVTPFPLSLDTAAGTDSNGVFLVCPGRVDIRRGEWECPRLEQLGKGACPPPGDPQETPKLQSLHCTVKRSHQPPRVSLGTAPSTTFLSQTWGSKGAKESSHVLLQAQTHYGTSRWLPWWALQTDGANEVQGFRWGRTCFSLVGAHPVWLQTSLVTLLLFAATSHRLRNTEQRFWLWRPWDPKSWWTWYFALSFSFPVCESPVTLMAWNIAGNCFHF